MFRSILRAGILLLAITLPGQALAATGGKAMSAFNSDAQLKQFLLTFARQREQRAPRSTRCALL